LTETSRCGNAARHFCYQGLHIPRIVRAVGHAILAGFDT